MPALGLGTWMMGEHRRDRKKEVAAIALGLDLGMTLIDTAEMYADGGAEELVGEAIAGRRSEVFLVSKVLPEHARRREAVAACERSLARMRTDHLDLYLLHWRENVPLDETLDAFDALVGSGKILEWGVSNFDVGDMRELAELRPSSSIASDQVLYNLGRRGIEWELMPWCVDHRIPIMAYSPIEQGKLLDDPTLDRVARERGVSAACIALAWVLRREGVIAIPKSGTVAHMRENHAALDVRLTMEEMTALDRAFPAPAGPVALETL